MSLVKFYRGSANVSLPAHSEGSIFVIARDDTHGDIYVDVEQGKRLHIVPDSPVEYGPLSTWGTGANAQQSELGKIYVITDYKYDEENQTYISGIKVGDGNAYVASLPIFSIQEYQTKAEFWDNKVTAFIDPSNPERLVLSKD